MIYFGVIFVLIVCNLILYPINNNNKKKIYLFISFMILSLISALRSKNVGVDTSLFYKGFEEIILLKFSELDIMRYEYGFMLLCKFLSYITHNPQILIIVTSIFINYAVVKFIYLNSKNVSYSIYIYILLNHYFLYMNVMRQAIAIAIILLALEDLKQNNIKKFVVWVLVATMFHYSAILCISFIFIKQIQYKKKYNLALIILSIFITINIQYIFLLMAKIIPQLAPYVGSEFDTSNYFGALFNFLVSVAILIFGIFCNKQYDEEVAIYKNSNDCLSFIYKLIICYVICSLLEMQIGIFNRITPYFSIFAIIWIPNNLIKILKSKTRLCFNVFVFMFLFMYFFIIAYYRPYWYGCIPYTFFIE